MGVPGIYTVKEAAAAVGLSLRTVRCYRREGLVVPSSRVRLSDYDELGIDLAAPDSEGLFVYGEADLERLRLLKPMKPLTFSFEEMREVLRIRAVAAGEVLERQRLVERLEFYAQQAEVRGERLGQVVSGAAFAAELRRWRQGFTA